jgi:hypothetical protein
MVDTIYGIICFLAFVGYGLLFAHLCRKKAIKKRRGSITWSILGFLFGIISFIVLSLSSELKEPPSSETQKINCLSSPGIVIGFMYLLYSVISIILSFLDRTYSDIEINILFFILGLVFLTFSFAFRNRQKYGWFGYTILLLLVAVLSALNFDIYKIILGVFAIATFAFTISPSVRKLYFTP